MIPMVKLDRLFVVLEWTAGQDLGDLEDVVVVGHSRDENEANALRNQIQSEGGVAIVVPSPKEATALEQRIRELEQLVDRLIKGIKGEL